ncbi:acyltransferase [Paenibacillus aceti]|uniref:Acyltransferase n=2 Tax=Paenibacillus aceti TaxID=1820010 RepID=A0ABQ1VRK1_9BACL|nr:fucose 4-O-acetylase [Paenibacillus aceti]GGF91130.1 acyltransferase [Paenibacillus aceti]
MTNHCISSRGETFFLNLRFLLIVCVFVGNAIEPLITRLAGMEALYMWIFTFHMPLFVLVTGYFARSNLFGDSGRKALLQIGLQYAIFQTLYLALDALWFHVHNTHYSYFAPYLLLWFLASHVCWRLLKMLIHRWSLPQQIITSILLGISVGYLPVDGVWFSISRTFVFFPFFIIGYHLSFARLRAFYTRNVKILSMTASVLLLLFIAIGGMNIAPGWLYGNMTYVQLGEPAWYTGFFRLLLYLLQLVAAASFLAFVPWHRSALTDMGRRTLYVFLLHGFIIRLAALSPIYDWIHSDAASLGIIAAAVAMTLLLCQPFVRRLSSPMIEPSIQWLLNLERRATHSFGTRSASKP